MATRTLTVIHVTASLCGPHYHMMVADIPEKLKRCPIIEMTYFVILLYLKNLRKMQNTGIVECNLCIAAVIL